MQGGSAQPCSTKRVSAMSIACPRCSAASRSIIRRAATAAESLMNTCDKLSCAVRTPPRLSGFRAEDAALTGLPDAVTSAPSAGYTRARFFGGALIVRAVLGSAAPAQRRAAKWRATPAPARANHWHAIPVRMMGGWFRALQWRVVQAARGGKRIGCDMSGPESLHY